MVQKSKFVLSYFEETLITEIMNIKYLGHACFQIYIGGKYLVFDPFIRNNPLAIEAGINIDDLKADYILVSHAHSDHIEDLVYLAQKTNATVVSSYEVVAWLGKQGYANGHPLNVSGKWAFDFGTIKMTPATHSSSFADGSYAGIAAGFLIYSEGKTLYFSGDTGLTSDMKIIGDLNKIDCAILPIGDNFTMGIEDACHAADFVKCNNIVASHFDTFGYIKIDHEKAISHFKQNGKELHILKIGGSIEL